MSNTSDGVLKDAIKNTAKSMVRKPLFKRVITAVLVIVCLAAAANGTAFYYAKTSAITRDEAIELAKTHLQSNKIELDTASLYVNDVEHDIEVELLDIKTSYFTYEIEFGKQDKSRIFVDVNATTGACSLRKISPPWWKAIIPD